MVSFISFLIFCQVLGALIGVGTAIWAEIAYMKAMGDGKIDNAENVHLRAIAKGLTFGMTLLLSASLALVIATYFAQANIQPALTTNYWLLIVFAVVAIYATWALSKKCITFALGSAIAFTAWWFLAYVTLGQLSLLSFGVVIAFFVVTVGIFYVILQYARMLSSKYPPPN